jgi:iron complex transport system permease protein
MTTATVTLAGKAARGHVSTRLAVCAAAVVIAVVVSLSIGPTGVSLASLPEAVAAATGMTRTAEADHKALVLLQVRLPRILLGLFVGAALAVSGALLQALFRNPLADPGLIGVSSGAALAAVATIAFGNGLMAGFTATFGLYALPLAAFLGGLGCTAFLLAIATRHGEVAVATLLLAGVAVAAMTGAATGLIAYASDDRELRDLTLWSMGSLSGASWPKVAAALPFTLMIVLAVVTLVRPMNALLLGEAEAFHLGVDVGRAKWTVIVVCAAAVGAAVAVSGVVGFVGLVVPHLVRLWGGADHRFVLPASALLGSALVLTADAVARVAVAPAELPLGIVMAVLGAPVFLHLVVRAGVGAHG